MYRNTHVECVHYYIPHYPPNIQTACVCHSNTHSIQILCRIRMCPEELLKYYYAALGNNYAG